MDKLQELGKVYIQSLRKDALKSHDKPKTLLYGTLFSELQQFEIDNRKPLQYNDIIFIIKKNIKKRQESSKLYHDAGRYDLEEIENKEIQWLQDLLPKQLDDTQIQEIVYNKVYELNATSMKQMGMVMKELQTISHIADMQKVSAMVRQILQG